jgi:hypothetical protein
MRFKRNTSFRPAIESVESRILATAGLAVASTHPAQFQAESTTKAQAWVKIVNTTSQALVFQLSGNGGATFQTFRLGQHSSGFFHVNRADSTFLLRINGQKPVPLATGPTRGSADAYNLGAIFSVTPVSNGGGGGGGSTNPVQNVARFSIINQTSSSSKPGGVAVKIDFSVDGGKTFTLSDTVPYTDGRTPRQETIHYGSQGILYKIPANPTLPPTPLTTFGQYLLFSNTNFQPYLFPSS